MGNLVPKRGASEEYALSEEQLNQLWKVCYEIRDKVLVGLLAFCGMRVGEAIHLRLAWIREGEIHIPSSMPCNCWGCSDREHWRPKSKMGIRTISIPGFLRPILAEFLKDCPDGLRITRQAAWYRVQWLVDRAGLPHSFPHSLRATAATFLASRGFTGAELCQMFGWARLEMGEHYVRIAEARRGAQAKMKQIWG